jgi:hypothetical protein
VCTAQTRKALRTRHGHTSARSLGPWKSNGHVDMSHITAIQCVQVDMRPLVLHRDRRGRYRDGALCRKGGQCFAARAEPLFATMRRTARRAVDTSGPRRPAQHRRLNSMQHRRRRRLRMSSPRHRTAIRGLAIPGGRALTSRVNRPNARPWENDHILTMPGIKVNACFALNAPGLEVVELQRSLPRGRGPRLVSRG